ncbi:MAG: ATPase [Porphyromonas sp.]|nr:ATPase [Porphyromonas sp.]
MSNILLADSGSTKTTWAAITSEGRVLAKARTEGLNPFFKNTEEIVEILRAHLLGELPTTSFEAIYFYGAGATPEKAPIVEMALRQLFEAEYVSVRSDMLAAARALCLHKPGVACILGTGANSCSYDGEEMVENVSPLGYILGDEGSGAVLGKLFIGALLKNQLPKGLKEEFLNEYETDPAEIIDRVYRKPAPNTYLASFSPFIARRLGLVEVYDLVEEAFRSFIVRNVKQYEMHSREPVHFVGSVAVHYEEPLRSACDKEGIKIGRILKEPMDGLIEYHSTK